MGWHGYDVGHWWHDFVLKLHPWPQCARCSPKSKAECHVLMVFFSSGQWHMWHGDAIRLGDKAGWTMAGSTQWPNVSVDHSRSILQKSILNDFEALALFRWWCSRTHHWPLPGWMVMFTRSHIWGHQAGGKRMLFHTILHMVLIHNEFIMNS